MTESPGVSVEMKESKERVMTRSRARAISEPGAEGLKRTKSIHYLGAQETASGGVDELLLEPQSSKERSSPNSVASAKHQLTLQCVKWRKEAKDKERMLGEVKDQQDALERHLSDIRGWSEEAEQALLKAKLEIDILGQHSQDSFNAGRAAGRLEMASSDEYRAAIRQAALLGIKEYLRSSTFKMLWAARAAEHEAIGFIKCRSRVLELGGFKEGFDVGLLDCAKGGNLDDDVGFGARKCMFNK